jgi:hypothetical protein
MPGESTLTPAPDSTPTAITTPAPIATPAPPEPPTATETFILPAFLSLSSRASGVDDQGKQVTITEAPVQITQLQGDVTFISLPVAIPTGSSLESFLDPETGISVDRREGKTVISIPVKDQEGRTLLTITVIVKELAGTGSDVQAIVLRMELQTTEQSLDLSEADPDVGTVAASISSEITRIPDSASISVTVSKEPTPEAQTAFLLAAEEAGTSIKDIAFTISVEKSNLQEGTDLKQSFITMKVEKAWTERVGIDNIRIIRVGDDGGREILQTSFLGFDDQGRATFRGFSPRGFSVFGLAALDAPPQGTIQALIGAFGYAKLSTPDGDIIVLVPENPGPEPLLIRLTPISVAAVPAPAPEGFGIVGKLFILEALGEDLSPREDLIFDIPLQLVVFYTQEDLEALGADESELIMAQYRTSERKWRLLHTSQDPHQQRVIASTEQLSYFALMARGITTQTVALPGVGGPTPGTFIIVGILAAGVASFVTGVYFLRRTPGYDPA